jgi:hypothetical protein
VRPTLTRTTTVLATNVTIHGNGNVLDAAKKGRLFFSVNASAVLALVMSTAMMRSYLCSEGDLTVKYASSYTDLNSYAVSLQPSLDFWAASLIRAEELSTSHRFRSNLQHRGAFFMIA